MICAKYHGLEGIVKRKHALLFGHVQAKTLTACINLGITGFVAFAECWNEIYNGASVPVEDSATVRGSVHAQVQHDLSILFSEQ